MRVGEALSVIWRAFALLARHWPTLLVLWLLGWIGSDWVTTRAVDASEWSDVAALVVLALAPVSTMAAMLISLRVLRRSSPTWVAPTALPGTRIARFVDTLDGIGSVLIPFLAVYMSQGALRELVTEYLLRGQDKVWSESFDNGGSSNAGGLPAAGLVMGAVAAFAFGLRWLVRRRGRRPVVAIPAAWLGAWVEAAWLVSVVMFVNVWRGKGVDWVKGRRVIRGIGDVAGRIADATGWLGDPLRDAWGTVARAVGALDKVVLAPLALLTVGAVVYGVTIAKPESRPLPGEAVVRSRLSASRVGVRWSRVAGRLPVPTGSVGRHVQGRFAPLVNGLRLVARSGLTPMMLFCVAYVGIQTGADWLDVATRRAIGPKPLGEWIALTPIIDVATSAVAGVVSVALIAAAIERLIAGQAAVGDVPRSVVDADQQVDGVVAGGSTEADRVGHGVDGQQEHEAQLER